MHLDLNADEAFVIVIKGTFSFRVDGTVVISEQQVPFVYADEFSGKPGKSSVTYEYDLSPFKSMADIVLLGFAYSPSHRAVERTRVSIEVGNVRKDLMIVGDRYWTRGVIGGIVPSKPKPFVKMPLIYERSFGGFDCTDPDVRKHAWEPRNPVGTGLLENKNSIKGNDIKLPNIENPRQPIEEWDDRPSPSSFGIINRNWQPRVRLAGTYDSRWLEEQFPLLPLDFSDEYYQIAPEDMRCQYFRGGELVKLRNVAQANFISFSLPVAGLAAVVRGKNFTSWITPNCDTLILEPELLRFQLIWRAKISCTGGPQTIREIVVSNQSNGLLKSIVSGKKYVRWNVQEQ